MAEWFEQECRPFDLYETDDGFYYQAIGTEDNPERIEAIEIIKALDRIAENEGNGDKTVVGIRIIYGNIDGVLDIRDSAKLQRFEKDGDEYIKLPNVEFRLQSTVFEGKVSFSYAQFGDETDFISAQFGERTSFSSAQFGEITSFSYAQFGEGTSFSYAQFGDETSFISAQFGEGTSFGYAQFGERTDFSSAQFGEITSFSYAQFGEITSFSYAQFGNETSFISAQFGDETDFISAQFGDGTYFRSAQFGERTDFRFAQFKSVAFFGNVKYWSDSPRVTTARWLWKDGIWGRILRKVLFLPKNSPPGKPRKATEFYLDNQNIDEVSNPHFKRYVADQQYIRSFHENHNVIYWLWRISSNCGRSLSLWAFWSTFWAGLFGFVYRFASTDAFTFGNEKLGDIPNLWSCIYYSVVTFTTLGFGDILPQTSVARGLVMLEVIFGYIMLGGLISIFANKLARRS